MRAYLEELEIWMPVFQPKPVRYSNH